MPVVYAPAAPVAGAYQSTYNLATAANRLANARAQAAQGGADARALAQLYSNDADRMQAAITGRDRQALEAEQFRAQLDQQNAGRAQEQGMQRERFALEAELQAGALTQQEVMRLQRMKNALGEIANDPKLTDEEKANFSLMLKTGINRDEMRLAKQRADMFEMEKRTRADLLLHQAKIQGAELELYGKTAESRMVHVVDPDVLAEIKADLVANGLDRVPMINLDQVAKQRAIEQGLARTYYQAGLDKLEELSGGGSGTGKSGTGASVGSGDPARRAAQIVKDVWDSVDAKIKDREDVTPEMRSEMIESELAARMAAEKKISEALGAGQEKGKVYRKLGSQTGSRAKPFDLADPRSGTLAQRSTANNINDDMKLLGSSERLTDSQKEVAKHAGTRALQIISEYGGEDGRLAAADGDGRPIPDDVRRELKDSLDVLAMLADHAKAREKPAAPAPVPPAPPHAAPIGGLPASPRTHETGPSSFGARMFGQEDRGRPPTPAEAAEDFWRNVIMKSIRR